MATQLQATIIGVDSTTLPESKDLSFPMRSIFLVESGDGCIVKFKNKDYYSSDAIGDLVSAELVQATVLRTNTSVLPNAKQMAFPGSDIVISATSENGASAIIEHDGVSYFVSETPDDLVSDANAGGGAVETVTYQLKTILTDAQIKALPGTYTEVVPAQGASKIALVNYYTIAFKSPQVDYSGVVADSVYYLTYGEDEDYATTERTNAGDFLSGNNLNIFPGFTGEPYNNDMTKLALSAIVNMPINFYLYNTELDEALTGGDPSNEMVITVYYTIEDLS
jgi:hypothetical protein